MAERERESNHLFSFKLKKIKTFKSTFRKENLHTTDHWLGEKRGLVGHTVSRQPALEKELKN